MWVIGVEGGPWSRTRYVLSPLIGANLRRPPAAQLRTFAASACEQGIRVLLVQTPKQAIKELHDSRVQDIQSASEAARQYIRKNCPSDSMTRALAMAFCNQVETELMQQLDCTPVKAPPTEASLSVSKHGRVHGSASRSVTRNQGCSRPSIDNVGSTTARALAV